MVAPTSLASCFMELLEESPCPDDVDAIARQPVAAASNRCAFTPISHDIVGIVPAPGVQILRLVNIESQYPGIEYPHLQAPFPRHPHVLGEAVGAKVGLDSVRGRAP